MTRHLLHCIIYKEELRRQAGYEGNATSQGMTLIDNLMGWSSARDRQVMNRDRLKERVLRIIIAGNLSFSFAENPEFVDLLNDAYPDMPAPTHKTVVDFLHAKATLTKAELRELLSKLESKVSLALDVWTTRSGLAFLGTTSPWASFVGDFYCNVKVKPDAANPPFHVTMLMCVGVTIHFIDENFRLQQELLGFVPLTGHHTGEYMAEVVYDLLEEYGIKEKLFCITTDNASNNIALVKELSYLLANDGISWDYKTHHIPCLAHIINLVVQKFLKVLVKDLDVEDDLAFDDLTAADIQAAAETTIADNEFDPASFGVILGKIRSIAKSIRGSSLRWEIFQQACKSYDMEPMTIPLDITVRWNSAYRMLLQALYLRRPIHRYVDDCIAKASSDRLKRPWMEMQLSNAEWEQAEVLLMFLLPFKRCTARFECNSEYTEIDYVFFAYNTMYDHIDDVKAKLESNTGIGTLPCAKYMLKAIGEMEVVLKKYYEKTVFPTVYADGMILNPRTKLIIFEDPSWEDTSAEEYSNACRRRFVEMYDTTNATSASTVSPSTASPSIASPSIVSPSTSAARNHKRIASHIDPEYRQVLLSRSSKRRRNDYDRFIEIPNDPDIASGIGWWRDHWLQYRDLALMARDVLAVPASGCAVERQFSISGRMTVWQRNRLSPRVISDAMIFKAALAHTRCPLRAELDNVDDVDQLPVDEKEGSIPDEWINGWWTKQLERGLPGGKVADMFNDGGGDVEEDLYG